MTSLEIEFGKTKLSDYTQIAVLGQGAYGIVRKAFYKNNPSHIVAMKEIIGEMQLKGLPNTSLREIGLLRELKSPYIIKLLDVLIEKNKLFLIFEYANIDLKTYINKLNDQQKVMDPLLVKKLLYQLISGVALIHQKRFIHRDLKTLNLLITDDLNLKIADFGLARTYFIPNRPYSEGVVTLMYRAPEVLLGCTEYNYQIDMWSVGCIFAEMVLGRILFNGTSEQDQLYRIARTLGTPNETIWPGVSKLKEYCLYDKSFPLNRIEVSVDDLNLNADGLNLLNSLLTYDPEKRITAKDAINHPYFTGAI